MQAENARNRGTLWWRGGFPPAFLAPIKKLGLEHEAMLLVDVTADGSIVLRPAGIYPISKSGRVR
ncbi:MAG: hypothetical protein DI596_07495 [Azospira oryzae]|nr:MAG: hypothetical protein DI596_07495 [Azospira oryzae]PZP79911.1 MAG: hypothetical protein DI593_07495 [Azospira oryzae]